MKKDRLRKLAEKLDSLVEADARREEYARQIAELRHKAAAEIHSTCRDLVWEINELTALTRIELDPPQYSTDWFREDYTNLIQIHARGRIIQIEFQTATELVSTEEFRVPYTLHGAIRCFNQELLQQDLIQEQLLFYCLEKSRNMWRFFDARTYRTGPLDPEYLVSLLEQIV